MKPTLRAIALTGLIFSSASAQNVNRDAIQRPEGLYEVFVRDFSPAGNFKGVTAGLDRIQATGADVVWLMPIYPIGKVNRKGTLGSPYSVADYRGINPDFGNAADLRQLVSAVHARKMKIILDFVPNHTAFDHSWITQHPDRYTHDKSGKISVAIDNDGKLTDWTDVADLNYDNPETRRAIIGDMKAERDCFSHRRSVMRRIQTLVVKPVSHLVQKSEDASGYVGSDKTHSDTYVSWSDRCTEWVLSQVNARALEIESDCLCNALRECALTLQRKSLCCQAWRCMSLLECLDEWNEIGRK